MGGFNGFEDLNAQGVVSIREFSRQFWEEHGHAPLVAMDMSHHIMQVSTEGKTRNEGIAHVLLFKRISAYLKVGMNLVCVFDGPLAEAKKRHSHAAQASNARQFGPMAMYAKKLCALLQLTCIAAPNEAEALCAWLQRKKIVDIVFSGDADVLANGALNVMRFTPAGFLKNAASATGGKNSHAEERLVEVYKLDEGQAPRFALMAMILGNDWEDGIVKLGKKAALGIVHPRTKMVDRMVALAQVESKIEQEKLRIEWHDDLQEELRTNKNKWFTRKLNITIPFEFPSVDVFTNLLNPIKPTTELTCDTHLTATSTLVTSSQLHVSRAWPDFKLISHKRSQLYTLWSQNCPGFRKTASTASISEEKSEKSFVAALGPLVLTNLLITNSKVAGDMEYKEVRNKLDVEVVKGTYVGSNFAPEFFIGTKVPHFMFNLNEHVKLPQKAVKKKSHTAEERAAKSNFKITEFFSTKPTASKSSSMPESFNSGDAFAQKANRITSVLSETDNDEASLKSAASQESSLTDQDEAPVLGKRRSTLDDDTSTEVDMPAKKLKSFSSSDITPFNSPLKQNKETVYIDLISSDDEGNDTLIKSSQSITRTDSSADLSDCVVVSVNPSM